MNTECTPDQLEFQGFKKQKVMEKHDAEISSSDGGLMCFCENNNVDYIFGLARNKRLYKKIDLFLDK